MNCLVKWLIVFVKNQSTANMRRILLLSLPLLLLFSLSLSSSDSRCYRMRMYTDSTCSLCCLQNCDSFRIDSNTLDYGLSKPLNKYMLSVLLSSRWQRARHSRYVYCVGSERPIRCKRHKHTHTHTVMATRDTISSSNQCFYSKYRTVWAIGIAHARQLVARDSRTNTHTHPNSNTVRFNKSDSFIFHPGLVKYHL